MASAVLHLRQGFQAGTVRPLRLSCPGCKHAVTLDRIGTDLDFSIEESGGVRRLFGQRRCPNCNAHLFVVFSSSGAVERSYPPERVNFDATDLPESVEGAMEEAVACHSEGCYIAAAIMVRKTLEEVCRDREAKGGNLKERIKALGSKVVLPKEMLDALDDLRLLGNDAAHVESRTYDDVGAEEVEIALDVTKEILKATYQYGSIMGRLRALQGGEKPATT